MATLGEQAVGNIVKLNVNGAAWDFIVVHQGLPSSDYDGSCDGTWLLMKDVYMSMAFDSTNNRYADSNVHSYLNATFLNLIDNDIREIVKNIKIPYNSGNSATGLISTGSNGLDTQVFLLSATEIGISDTTNALTEGAVLSYFNNATDSKRIAYLNNTATMWTLRSRAKSTDNKTCLIMSSGKMSTGRVTFERGIRPALVLPYELGVDGSGAVTIASGAITGSVPINGVQRELTGKGYINIGGILRDLADSQGNIGGVLKSLKG